jgi:uncharacterized protein
MTPQRVEFPANEITLVGHLHLASGAGRERLGALVITGPTPAVKEQAADRYAERLAEAGYIALTFDHRNFGESGGDPRQREDSAGKLVDIRAAVSFLAAQPSVNPDRIGIVGVCIGGGYALRAAAFDPRIKAFVGIAGFYPSPYSTRDAMGAETYRKALLDALTVIQGQDQGGPIEYFPHVALEGEFAAPPGEAGEEAYEFYGTQRGHHPNYRNQYTRDTTYAALTLDFAMGADFLSPTPALIVHGEIDAGCPPSLAQNIYERLGEPKRIVWLPTTKHVDFYDNDAYITSSVMETVRFLEEYL